MTEDEVVVRYNQAKNRMAQIKILAELNNCDKSEIVGVLKARGCELPGQYAKKKVETPEAAMQRPETPEGNVRKAERPMDRVALEDVIDIFIEALDSFREPPDGVDRSDTAKLTLAYMSGAADAFKALHGPIVR